MRADTPYELKIDDDFRTMRRLLESIEPPPGHHWTVGAGNPLRWCLGSIAESTRYSASVMLRREVWDMYDDRQLHVEVRVGWDEVGKLGTTALPASRRAILWCEMGPRINFTSTSLIDDRRSRYRYAPDIVELFGLVRAVVVPALAIYDERLAALDAERAGMATS